MPIMHKAQHGSDYHQTDIYSHSLFIELHDNETEGLWKRTYCSYARKE